MDSISLNSIRTNTSLSSHSRRTNGHGRKTTTNDESFQSPFLPRDNVKALNQLETVN